MIVLSQKSFVIWSYIKTSNIFWHIAFVIIIQNSLVTSLCSTYWSLQKCFTLTRIVLTYSVLVHDAFKHLLLFHVILIYQRFTKSFQKSLLDIGIDMFDTYYIYIYIKNESGDYFCLSKPYNFFFYCYFLFCIEEYSNKVCLVPRKTWQLFYSLSIF